PEESERKLKEALGYNVQSNSSLKLRKDPQQSTLFTAVRVTQPSVETAGHFWVVSNEMGETFKIKDETRDLTNIQSCINSAISNDEAPPLSLEGITPGHVCLAKYKDIDGLQSYYRARIEEVHCDSNVLVYFVDYGNTEFVDGEDLRALPVGLTDVNMKAMECMLAELKPAPKYGEAWGEEVTNWVQIQIENQYCLLEIYSIVHGVLRVKVLKKHEGKEISLSDELISKGYAVCADESYLSKQNRGLRAIYSSHLQDISTSNACTLTSAVSSLSLNCDSKSSVFEGKEEKIFLRPYSPLLLKFMPLTRPLNYSSVHVEMSSVNSTALDLEPQSPRSRLMVASFAGLNSCESMVILRNTTLMPPIPGLLSLCLLLFCPVAELRVNNECTRYTGALIGLGYDEENGRAIYPDEDIELEFDVNFTQNDLITINMVRYLMDAALQEKDEISSHMLISIRKKLRKLIISLLEEGRAYKDPEPHQQLYRWNMVPKEDVLPPIAVELADEAGGLVFPLHCGIVLRPENCPEKLRNKLSELKNLQARLAAEESTPYTEVNRTCPLCLVPLKSLLNLELHMASTAHMYEERRLEKSSSSMVQDDEV
ncbi:ATP-dependent RNA helicase TDRD9-like 3, partial [Homarus americanus]